MRLVLAAAPLPAMAALPELKPCALVSAVEACMPPSCHSPLQTTTALLLWYRSTAGGSTARASAPRCPPPCCAAVSRVSIAAVGALESKVLGASAQLPTADVCCATAPTCCLASTPPPSASCSVGAAVRGARRLCLGVARLGGAHAAASHLHAAARGLPHPRR